MYRCQVELLFIFLPIAYDMTDSDNHIRLKVPKRTMSAYACFSRTVYVQIKTLDEIVYLSSFIFSYKSVRDEMGDQPRQSDVFREIASRWKVLPPEEKIPFEEEAKRDRIRYKTEMQQYHKLRRDLERSISRYGNFTDPHQFRNSKYLQRALQNHDSFRSAQILLEAGDHNQKEVLEVLQECIRIMITEGQNVRNHMNCHVVVVNIIVIVIVIDIDMFLLLILLMLLFVANIM